MLTIGTKAIVKSYNPLSTCAAPEKYLGLECTVLEVHQRMQTCTVQVYDSSRYEDVSIMLDKQCLEVI